MRSCRHKNMNFPPNLLLKTTSIFSITARFDASIDRRENSFLIFFFFFFHLLFCNIYGTHLLKFAVLIRSSSLNGSDAGQTRREHHRHPHTGRHSWLTTQPPHNCRHFFNLNSELGEVGWVRPYESEAGLWSDETANSAGTCSAFLFGASTSPCVKNYTSPKLSQSAPSSYWLFPAAAAPENE